MIDFTAHPFFPDLLENQRRSVHSFFEKGILEELELFSYVGSGGFSQASSGSANSSLALKLEVRQTLARKKHKSSKIHPRTRTNTKSPKQLLDGNLIARMAGFSGSIPSKDFQVQTCKLSSFQSQTSSKSSASSDFERVPRKLESWRGALSPSSQPTLSIRRTNFEILLHASKFVLKKPQLSIQEAIRQQKTYSAGFYLPVEIREIQEPSSGLVGISPRSPMLRTILENITPSQIHKSFGGHQTHTISGAPAPRWFYFGEIPLMTERGSFLINGAPRVLVNQIVRCPSVYFKLKVDEKNRRSYIASFLSDYGSWLRLETDRLRPRLWVRIDKSPRFPIEFLFQALGFGGFRERTSSLPGGISPSNEEARIFLPAESIQLIWKKCNPGRWGSALSCYSFFYNKFFNPRRYSLGRVGRLRLNKRLNRRPDCQIPTLTPEDVLLALDYLIQLQDGLGGGGAFSTLPPERGGTPGTNLQSLKETQPRALPGTPTLDDIDHLKNRRVRLPGEIIQNQFRLALSRVLGSAPLARTSVPAPTQKLPTENLEGSESEKLSTFETGGQTSGARSPSGHSGSESLASFFGGSPSQNFVSTLRELFNTSQLSQYMDQTNPLAEITHKRRLSSLGPGGVSRDQAGFAVREIHPSHFGRICPIETPEGQNAGLVGSLASYARINADGFLQSPASPKLARGRIEDLSSLSRQASVLRDVYLFTADIEDEVYLCTADIGQALEKYSEISTHIEGFPPSGPLGEDLSASNQRVFETSNFEAIPTRFKQEFITLSPDRIQFRGICPIQMISVATSLIPFLEHDDANRALMGSNMQRQAVPLMVPEKAFVGTGFELQAARDSSTLLLAPQSGYVEFVDSQSIGLWNAQNLENLSLIGYSRSNQSTCLRQRPAVQKGDWVEAGDLLADGSATHDGEVALGKNILAAYLPWEGYNFEDAIVINERLVYQDIYTSVHIERYELDVRNISPLRIFHQVDQESSGSLRTGDSALSESSSQFSRKASQDTNSLENPQSLQEDSRESNARESQIPVWDELSSESQRPISSSPPRIWPPRIGTEYMTNDLDILRGTPTSLESTWESGGIAQTSSEVQTENPQSQFPFNSSTATLAEQIRNLDSDGVVRPGTWIEESSILIGKVTAQAAPSSRKAFDLQRRGSPGGNSRSSAQNPGSSPEYRLLLAILGGGPGTSLPAGTSAYSANKISKATALAQFPGKIQGGPPPQSFIRFQNTSIKAGLGLRGRVLECIIPWRDQEAKSRARIQEFPKSKQESPSNSVQSGRSPSLLQIFIAHKKRIQVGDKMSGRHGNKGIVSLILAPQDMPYLQDGTPLDIVLNPLGVPSRMNVGQVLESLLGLAAQYLGEIYRLLPFEPKSFDAQIRFCAPAEDSNNLPANPETSRSLVYSKLREARNKTGSRWLFDPNSPGKMQVFDGRTGELFHQPILVGYSYMFKLIHLVDDKIHARSTGPYSLVTQQPLGGRSKKGGQRLGEMEVWALEGFGAAYLLQEFLTLKSDEIYSRNTFLLNLMKRSSNRAPFQLRSSHDWGSGAKLARPLGKTAKTYVPESFRVLVNELQSLCLSVYYNPDFRLSYPSLLGRESTFSGLLGFLSEKVSES